MWWGDRDLLLLLALSTRSPERGTIAIGRRRSFVNVLDFGGREELFDFLQCIFDFLHICWALLRITGDHVLDERVHGGQSCAVAAQWLEMERVLGRIFAGEQEVQQGTEAIDIGTWRCLSSAILFGRSEAGRA